jgi:23S rRNA pseudouridine2605 synthase
MDSEGLLLFTNDGEFANSLMHPKHEVNKTYHVTVTGFGPEKLHQLAQQVTLDGYTIRRPDVKLLKTLSSDRAVLSVTIHEGRNRQVRRMCDLAGMQVTRLMRVSEGSLNLGSLPSGKWRYLTTQEVERLQK